MEAAPRLPMIWFGIKNSTDSVSFESQLKGYIAAKYGEDPDSYSSDIYKLETLREAALRPTVNVAGCQTLKKYYCQLHFLKSRFPMEEGQECALEFSWKDNYTNMACRVQDIRFELMCILYNIGALHSQIGNSESRNTPDGMKMACTHFQCAAGAFQTVKEKYHEFASLLSTFEIVHFMHQVCLAQAQECILEKSMLDNRKATIIAKVAVQVHDYYRKSLFAIQSSNEDNHFSDLVGGKTCKEWIKYLQFKVAYHKCIALLFQGQQAEEQQKMGERVAFYQAACEQLDEARKIGSKLKNVPIQEINEALAFTTDVVEGKRKAAKNENEFIYHEEVPDKDALQEVNGASLVKGITFSVNDIEVSGPDIFARLVPMEAHEDASVYSEKKAQLLRQMCELVETKDQALAEFMSGMQLEFLNKMRLASGIPQDIIDRAAALSARPKASQELLDVMEKLSQATTGVEASLNEIEKLLTEEEEAEKQYQEVIGKRPPGIIATDLTREAAKYREAHNKANDSNQALQKALTTHIANLNILSTPLRQLQQQLPSIELPNPNIDENILKQLENLVAKVDEMRSQRAMLWAQFRDAVHKDDITAVLVTKQPNQSRDQVFQQELRKHQQLAGLIEQNAAAQENIKKALVECYADCLNTRRYITDTIQKRSTTISALITSFDTYEDFLTKASKGIEFYTKLETNVTKLLQRIRSACKVQQEEREQMLTNTGANNILKNVQTNMTSTISSELPSTTSTAPKLKDYLDSRKKGNPAINTAYGADAVQYPVTNYQGASQTQSDVPTWLPAVRPAPLGSEMSNEQVVPKSGLQENYVGYDNSVQYGGYAGNYNYSTQYPQQYDVENKLTEDLANRLNNLMTSKVDLKAATEMNYPYSNYIPQNYAASNYSGITNNSQQQYGNISQNVPYDPEKAFTTTINSYQPIASPVPQNVGNLNSYMNTPQGQTNYPTSVIQSSQQHQNQNNYVTTGMQQQQSHNNYPNAGINLAQQPQQKINDYQNVGINLPQQPQQNTNDYQTVGIPQQSQSNYQPQQKINDYQSVGINLPQQSQQKPNEYQTVGMPQQSQSNYPTTGMSYYPEYSRFNTYNTNTNYSEAGKSSTYNSDMSNTYYPAGYAPNYSGLAVESDQANAAGSSYHTAEYATSVQPNIQNYNYNSTYSSPLTNTSSSNARDPGYLASIDTNSSAAVYTPSPSQTNPSEYNYSSDPTPYNSATNIHYGAYGNYSYYPQTTSTYGTTPQTPTMHSQESPVPPLPVTTKESNIDLLSGLDFTISQIPLIPQTKTSNTTSDESPKKTSDVSHTTKSTGNLPEHNSKTTIVQDEPPVKDIPVPKAMYKIMPTRPLNNNDVKNLFRQELDKLEKFVDMLTNKTLSGPTNLDLKWKEIQDKQDCDAGNKKMISVARCYPSKNRFPDILPYDAFRVELTGTVDDYINASYVEDISPYAPRFIITQSPLPSTFIDFWTMIQEQQVELIFCLLNDNEIGEDVYWPKEKGKGLYIGNMVLTLQNIVVKTHWTERLISVALPEKRDSFVVLHLQFTSWRGSLFPTTAEPFVSLITELINLHHQQRVLTHPLVVHCHSGIGRSGLVCLLTSSILDVTNNATTIPDLAATAAKLSSLKKNILRDREHLKFAYECFLVYMKGMIEQDKLKQKLNEFNQNQPEDARQVLKDEIKEQIVDPLNSLDPFWASKKSTTKKEL